MKSFSSSSGDDVADLDVNIGVFDRVDVVQHAERHAAWGRNGRSVGLLFVEDRNANRADIFIGLMVFGDIDRDSRILPYHWKEKPARLFSIFASAAHEVSGIGGHRKRLKISAISLGRSDSKSSLVPNTQADEIHEKVERGKQPGEQPIAESKRYVREAVSGRCGYIEQPESRIDDQAPR